MADDEKKVDVEKRGSLGALMEELLKPKVVRERDTVRPTDEQRYKWLTSDY